MATPATLGSAPPVTFIRWLEGHQGPVSCVEVARDGKLAVSGSRDRTLRAWDLATGACIRTLTEAREPILALSLMADGRRAVTVDDGINGYVAEMVRVWDVLTGECLRGFGSTAYLPPERLALAEHGLVLVPREDRTVRVWSAHADRWLPPFAADQWPPDARSSITPDGRLIFVVKEGIMRAYEIATGEVVSTIEGIPNLHLMAAGRGGRFVVTGHPGGLLIVWEVAAARRALLAGDDSMGTSEIAVTPDGERAVSLSPDGIRIWDLEAERCLHALPLDEPFGRHLRDVKSLCLTPDGNLGVAALTESICVFHLRTGHVLGILDVVFNQSDPVAISPDGKLLLIGRSDGKVGVWEIQGGTEPAPALRA